MPNGRLAAVAVADSGDGAMEGEVTEPPMSATVGMAGVTVTIIQDGAAVGDKVSTTTRLVGLSVTAGAGPICVGAMFGGEVWSSLLID